jgi:hypothetical protein
MSTITAPAADTVAYREDRWWAILGAIGACAATAPYSWEKPNGTPKRELVAWIQRSPAVEDYWTVNVDVVASLHAVVSEDRVVGDGGMVTVHEVLDR